MKTENNKKEYTIEDRQKLLFILRKINGFTQMEVAHKAGITYSQYQRLESGERSIKTVSFDIACRIFNVLFGICGASLFYNGLLDWLLEYDATKNDPGLKRCNILYLNQLKNQNLINESSMNIINRIIDIHYNRIYF